MVGILTMANSDKGSIRNPIPNIMNIMATSNLSIFGNMTIRKIYRASANAPFKSRTQNGLISILLFARNVILPRNPSSTPYEIMTTSFAVSGFKPKNINNSFLLSLQYIRISNLFNIKYILH